MVRSPDVLEAQLLRLPPADRARLAELLLTSLDEGEEPGAEAAWAEEAERRLADLRAGTVAGIPAADVFARAAARLGA